MPREDEKRLSFRRRMIHHPDPEATGEIIREAFEPEIERSKDPDLVRELFAIATQYYRRMIARQTAPAESRSVPKPERPAA
jgi:hypothetical protein